jgi:2-methylisocitrate lyase-like PEP mutase family enzyme
VTGRPSHVQVRNSLVPPLHTSQDHWMDQTETRAQFRSLHSEGSFVMPNAHDLGSCRLLSTLGFDALATTSGGFAASMGRMDMTGTREDLVEHVRAICAATDLPVNADSERCFPNEPGGVGECVRMLVDAGAAGCSIEDWDPDSARIEDLSVARERVSAAAAVAGASGLVLTARAENHLHGRDDIGDTISRLNAYREAGAAVVYAPGLTDLAEIALLVKEVATPVNVLLMPGGPSVAQLSEVGVRRISIGSSLARIAYGALVSAAEHLQSSGVLEIDAPYLDRELAAKAFGLNLRSHHE